MVKCKFISHYAAFVSLSIIFVACESDQAKIQRLDSQKATMCLNQEYYERQYEMVALQVKTPLQDSLARMTEEYRTKCDLATRDYNRFMHE